MNGTGVGRKGEVMSIADDVGHGSGPAGAVDERGRLIACAGVLLPTLGAITAAAAHEPDLDHFVEAVVHHGSVFAIKSVMVWRVEHGHMELTAAGGYSTSEVSRYAHLPITANLPCADSVTNRRPVICNDRPELFAAYPLVERFVVATHALVSLPVIRRGQVIAGMSFHFHSPVAVDHVALSFLQGIADLVAVLFDAESTPLAAVLPLTVIPSPSNMAFVDDEPLVEEPCGEPTHITSRLDALERQMRSMRQLMTFLGAIANDRFDDAR